MKPIHPFLRTALFTLAVFCGPALYAQMCCTNNSLANLVPNPGFENYTSCPNSLAELNLAAPWFNPTEATPDYFNACAGGGIFEEGIGVPANFAGSRTPLGGQAYAGGYMLDGDYREYIEVPLLASLSRGHAYTVSFYVCLAQGESGNAIDNLGAYLSAGPVMSSDEVNLPYTPQVRNPPGDFLTSFSAWALIQGTYTSPAGGENYLTIGNFYDDANTPTVPVDGTYGSGGNVAYYYIDNVSVADTSTGSNVCTNACISISNPNDMVVYSCTNTQVYYTPIVTDTCCSQVTVKCYPASGSLFTPNTTTPVVCVVTDTCGNSNCCTFNVTVECLASACTNNCISISTPSDIVVNSCTNTRVFYTPTVIDTCCPNGTVKVSCNPSSGSYFAPGPTTTVTCDVTDSCGNSNSCSFSVTVECLTNACSNSCISIFTPADIVVNSCSNCVQEFYLPTATDTCCTNVKVKCDPPSGNCFYPGTTTVTCDATDTCGNSSSCSFKVTVLCTNANANACTNADQCLTIYTPADIVVNSCSNCVQEFYTPTATDTCCGRSQPMLTCTPASGYCFPLGTTTVTCTATDNCGNNFSCSFNVTVNPCLQITCPANITQVYDSAAGGAGIDFFLPTLTDTCGCFDPDVTVYASWPPLNIPVPGYAVGGGVEWGELFLGGETQVTITAINACGCSNSCTFMIKANPETIPPMIWSSPTNCYEEYLDCCAAGVPCGPWPYTTAGCQEKCEIDYEQCQNLGVYSVAPSAYQAPIGYCSNCTFHPYQFVISSGQLNPNFGPFSPITNGFQPIAGSTLMTNSSGGIVPVRIRVGGWDGTNVLSAIHATGVNFYTAPMSLVAQFAASNNLPQLPWTYAGYATNNPATGLLELQWTPTNYQSYAMNAVVYDPSLTNYFTNSLGMVTNGIDSIVSVVIPASAVPQLISPTLLPNTNFAFKVVGPLASNCIVQVSSDLKVWSNALTFTNFDGQANLIDASGSTNSKFYRALQY